MLDFLSFVLLSSLLTFRFPQRSSFIVYSFCLFASNHLTAPVAPRSSEIETLSISSPSSFFLPTERQSCLLLSDS